MQNFLTNPQSHVLAHLLREEGFVDRGIPISVRTTFGNHSFSMRPDMIAQPLIGQLAARALEQTDFDFQRFPFGEEVFPALALDAGEQVYLEPVVQDAADKYPVALEDWYVFSDRMVESEDEANIAFFTDFLVLEYDESDEGACLRDAHIFKLWEIAAKHDPEEDGGALCSRTDILGGQPDFPGPIEFLEDCRRRIESDDGSDAAEEWYETALFNIEPYLD